MENLTKINPVNGRSLSVTEMMNISGGGYPGCSNAQGPGYCSGNCTEYMEDSEGRINRYNGICMFEGNDGGCACARIDN